MVLLRPRLCSLALALVLLTGCARTSPPPALPYDPPNATITTDRPITPQTRRAFAFPTPGVGFTNAFAGGRISDLRQDGPDAYTLTLRPENAPVNNSAWYAFKAWADAPRTVTVRLEYEDGDHRYIPKLSRDGHTWQPIDPAAYAVDTTGTRRAATLRLALSPDTLWVAGQELRTSAWFAQWTDAFAAQPFVTQRTIGRSRAGRPLTMLTLTEAPASKHYVLLISRQHPPEVTGTLALIPFLETLAADTDLARRFRQKVQVLAVPLMNPDGVDAGHWRHNLGGVDLNRDWYAFNQPETRAVRDAFVALKQDPENKVYFGADFHSTQQDVFYTNSRDLPTFPLGFTDAWLDRIRTALPDYYVNDDPSGLGSPVSKNWFYETFQASGVTYEVGDEADRARIRQVATAAAEALMEEVLLRLETN